MDLENTPAVYIYYAFFQCDYSHAGLLASGVKGVHGHYRLVDADLEY